MKVALIQMNAQDHKGKNIHRALQLVLKAANQKTDFILLPELFHYRGPQKVLNAEKIPGESVVPFMIFAKARKVFILLGSVYEKAGRSKKIYNTSVLINDRGKIIARYRKINLFKARVGGKNIDETKTLKAGSKTALADIKGFKTGLTICYDLRFPGLFQSYARKGAEILCVPSSFTKETGQAHFETLLRSRAIENLCFVLAPNQTGTTKDGVKTYGNSMVIDPWGKIIARASGTKEEILCVTLEEKTLLQARKKLPAVFN